MAPDYHWAKQSRVTWAQIVAATDVVEGPLWLNDGSSYHGTNDKVSEALASGLTSSLLLIKPSTLKLVVGRESQYGGGTRRRIRASFAYSGSNYNFVVTDPWIEQKYFMGADGEFSLDDSRLCVSLAEVKNGLAVKLH